MLGTSVELKHTVLELVLHRKSKENNRNERWLRSDVDNDDEDGKALWLKGRRMNSGKGGKENKSRSEERKPQAIMQ